MSRVLWFTYAASWSRSLVRGELPSVLKEVDTADELSRGRWRALGVFEWCARSCSSPRLECTRSRQVAWKGRDSNPRPRHYELAAPLKIGVKFNSLPRDVPLRLAQRSTTEHDRLPQISRISWPRFWRLHPGPGTSAALTSRRNDFSNRGLLRYYLISLDCIGSPS